MHPLVRPVLLRGRRMNARVLDAQPHPPDVQVREPAECSGQERRPIVRADRAREPVLAERAREDRPRLFALHGREAMARQQEAGVLVRDRDRIAVEVVRRFERPFEVGGPQIVRHRRHRIDDTWMGTRRALPLRLYEALALEEAARRAHCRPRPDLAMPGLQPVEP